MDSSRMESISKFFEETLKFGFTEVSTDLATLTPTFGAAILFIDDCADGVVVCTTGDFKNPCPGGGEGYCDGYGHCTPICGQFGPMGFCYNWSSPGCYPCEPYDHLNPPADRVYEYWANKCNREIAACQNLGNDENGPVSCVSNF